MYFTHTTLIGVGYGYKIHSGYGYKIGTEPIAHLFYMGDLKLCAKEYSELEGLLRIVKGFSDDVGMEFGLSKRAKATFKRGKLERSDHVRLDEETMIKDLKQEKVYKYMRVDESSRFNAPQ